MKYSELEKMDHMEALLMLYRKIPGGPAHG